MGQCYSHLSVMEREEVSRGLALGHSVRTISRRLARSASSISREIGRNARYQACYRATAAQRRAQRCAWEPGGGGRKKHFTQSGPIAWSRTSLAPVLVRHHALASYSEDRAASTPTSTFGPKTNR